MAGKQEFTLDQILDAIKGSRAIKETIRKRLGCSRNTVDNYLKRYATAQQAYDDEVEVNGDIAEALIIDDMVRNKNVETAKWYAKAKLKKRGYSDQQDIKHSGSVDVIVSKGYVSVTPDDWDEDSTDSRL